MARRRPRLACSNAIRIFPSLFRDRGWLDLTLDAQWLYLALCCQPRTTTGPTVAYDPDLWVAFSCDATEDAIESSLRELELGGWVSRIGTDVHLLRLEEIMLPGAATAIDRERARVTLAVRRAVFARDGELCRACGATENLAIDHVVALASGGTSDLDNLAVLCRVCNGSKGSQPWAEWLEAHT